MAKGAPEPRRPDHGRPDARTCANRRRSRERDARIGEVEGLKSGEQGSLTVDLPAGDYVLLCNLVHVDGPIVESHYQFGMVDDFAVTE